MRVVIVYREKSDHGREVRDYIRDYQRFTGRSIEVIDPDGREGASFCRVYDIVEYPTIIALDDFGKMLSIWRGRPLPQIDQVSYYQRN